MAALNELLQCSSTQDRNKHNTAHLWWGQVRWWISYTKTWLILITPFWSTVRSYQWCK